MTTSDADYDNMPAIAITQWRTGRVLSDDDIKLIERLLREQLEDITKHAGLVYSVCERALFNLGGQSLVDIARKSEMEVIKAAVHDSLMRHTMVRARLDSMNTCTRR